MIISSTDFIDRGTEGLLRGAMGLAEFLLQNSPEVIDLPEMIV